MSTILQQVRKTALSAIKNAAAIEVNNPLGNVTKQGALYAVNKWIGLAIPFASRNHFEVVKLNNGYLKAKIPLKGNKNHIGTMYAGALFTIAELPGGILSIFNFDAAYYPILKELKMSYLKVAKTDVTVEFAISPKEVMRIERESSLHGKSNFTLHGELKDSSGQIVARSEALYQVRKQQ